MSLLSESSDVWVRTHDGGLIRADSITALAHEVVAPQTGYVVKAVSNGNPVPLIKNTSYVGSGQERKEQAKNMQDSLLLAINHGSGKLPTYVISYDDVSERWEVTELSQVPGIYQPAA